jgi:tRNA (uracil-5-)-methyltransferase TRM9
MDDRTARALNAINHSFYSEHAADFDATRSDPWPGWLQLLPWLDALMERHAALPLLDVGCGNGRLGAFLGDRLAAHRLHYTGVDSSEPLLARARARALPFARVELQCADFLTTPAALPMGPYALIALFGVLHHVPGAASRQHLLHELTTRLTPGGLLVLTCWQFEAFTRFQRRFISWDDYNRTASESIDTEQLEDGDHLLPWGDGGSALRYCNFTSEQEMSALLENLSLEAVSSYFADGREGNLNRYFICRFRNAQHTPKENEL